MEVLNSSMNRSLMMPSRGQRPIIFANGYIQGLTCLALQNIFAKGALHMQQLPDYVTIFRMVCTTKGLVHT